MPKRDSSHMAAQRIRILDASIRCIGEKGLEGTSIASICKQAELSAGALYVHFRNKDEIIAEALRHGIVQLPDLPIDWPAFKASLARFDCPEGLDIITAIRARLHLHAEIVRPGELHDIYRPLLRRTFSTLALHLQKMHDEGRVRLRFSAGQTAENICAFIDGMLWIALADDWPLEDFRSRLLAGLDGFVTLDPKPSNHGRPHLRRRTARTSEGGAAP